MTLRIAVINTNKDSSDEFYSVSVEFEWSLFHKTWIHTCAVVFLLVKKENRSLFCLFVGLNSQLTVFTSPCWHIWHEVNVVTKLKAIFYLLINLRLFNKAPSSTYPENQRTNKFQFQLNITFGFNSVTNVFLSANLLIFIIIYFLMLLLVHRSCFCQYKKAKYNKSLKMYFEAAHLQYLFLSSAVESYSSTC